MKPPLARVNVIKDTHYGYTVEDPYRWMEDLQSDEMQNWLKGQAEFSRSYFDGLPGREGLLRRVTELSKAGPVISGVKVAGDNYFYLRTDPGETLGKLTLRSGLDGPEKTLFDPHKLEGDTHTAIDWYYPSRDGQRVAYGISPGGSEDSILHVLDINTLEELETPVTRVRWGRVGWLPDHQSFFYLRYPEPAPDSPPAERRKNSRIYYHRPGSNPEQDPAVFGRGVNPAVEASEFDFFAIVTFEESPWILGLVIHGVMNELTIYALPSEKELISDPAKCPWVRVCDTEDGVVGFAVKGDQIYLRTHKDAPRYKVIATGLESPDLAHARDVVPASKLVVLDQMVVGNYLVTNDLEDGIGKLRRVSLDGGQPEKVPLPFEGSITECFPGEDEVMFISTSWTVSPRILRYRVETQQVTDTGWLEPSPVDFSEIEAHEVMATSKDGTQIPLSIIHRKGLKLDGNNPTWMAGYGNYGLIVYPPRFNPAMLAWYERGGVFAAAHIRGGGEYGKEWYKAAYKLTKQNNIDDFIACGEYLIKQGYTSSPKLAGEGVSGGGIPAGGALVQRPDLWGVIVLKVTVTDWFRFEFSENGPANIPEFGSLQTEEGFKGLQIMDSYSKIKDGEKYPAVLLTAGINDPRVAAWQPAKMAARLQAATASGKPVLLRVEYEGGHGMGSTQAQLNRELADELAFLLEQFA